MSVRSTVRFGGPGLAGATIGGAGHPLWVVATIVAVGLLAGLLLTHVHPRVLGRARRLLLR